MKKSIVTIALFSLALVTTSFTTVETSNSLSTMESTAQDPPISGGGGVCAGCGGKKVDIVQSETTTNTDSGQLNSFGSDKQSVENTKKLD